MATSVRCRAGSRAPTGDLTGALLLTAHACPDKPRTAEPVDHSAPQTAPACRGSLAWRAHPGECFSKQLPVLRVRVEESQGLLSDRLIAATSTVRKRYGVTFSVVKLTKSRTQCGVRNAMGTRYCEARRLPLHHSRGNYDG